MGFSGLYCSRTGLRYLAQTQGGKAREFRLSRQDGKTDNSKRGIAIMSRYVGKLVFIVLFTAAVLVPAHTQNDSVLAGSISLFGNNSAPPMSLDSKRGWVLLNGIDWNTVTLSKAAEGYSRSWRLRSSYEHDETGVPVTLQIRLRGNSGDPTFTHPWSDGAQRQTESYSNWYSEDFFPEQQDRGYLEARLVAAPRTPISGKLFSITLEAWDNPDSPPLTPTRKNAPGVQLAYASPLPNERIDRKSFRNPEAESAAALAFSLSFVESCITGNLPEYYRALADPVRVLDDGSVLAKYRLSPPKGIPGIQNLDDYKQRFSYSIYSAGEYRELFPEWFDTARDWTPNENSFLFMGHQSRLGERFPEGVNYLVFLTAPDENGDWKVVARPGN